MGDNIFHLHIKIWDIVDFGIVFEAIICGGRLRFLLSSSPRQVSMLSWTGDDMFGDLFFMTTSHQCACQR